MSNGVIILDYAQEMIHDLTTRAEEYMDEGWELRSNQPTVYIHPSGQVRYVLMLTRVEDNKEALETV